VLAVAYFRALRYKADDPHWEERDRFLLSIGHYAIALYSVLIEAGVLPEEELETYGADDSRLPMSGMAAYTPGMEITGGSLGQGLTVAVGMALGLKRKKSGAFIYNLLSDGELDEGATWEAAMSAAHWKLGNLIAIVDVNNQQADGPSSSVVELSSRWSINGKPSAGTCNGSTATTSSKWSRHLTAPGCWPTTSRASSFAIPRCARACLSSKVAKRITLSVSILMNGNWRSIRFT